MGEETRAAGLGVTSLGITLSLASAGGRAAAGRAQQGRVARGRGGAAGAAACRRAATRRRASGAVMAPEVGSGAGTCGGRGRVRPLVICGPSGVGKGTLIARLMEAHPEAFALSVSHTTRRPRPGEVNGVHYHFTDLDAMHAMVAAGGFLEHAHVHGNVYGTSFAAVQAVADEGKCCVLDIDVQGVETVRAQGALAGDRAMYVFVMPPGIGDLEARLRRRNTEDEDSLKERVHNARKEMDKAHTPGLFDHVVVNDDLDTCFGELCGLIFHPERGVGLVADSAAPPAPAEPRE